MRQVIVLERAELDRLTAGEQIEVAFIDGRAVAIALNAAAGPKRRANGNDAEDEHILARLADGPASFAESPC